MSKGYSSKKSETYLVNVTILEGRHYAWPNMNSYVHMKIAHETAVTKIRYGTDSPFYNEYFVFEFKTSLEKLLDQHLTLTVYRAKSCCKMKKVLGYVTVDLATIWEETDHQFYQKWAVLSGIKSNLAGTVGYLKVTLSILGAGEAPKIPLMNTRGEDTIEGNLLLPEGITERKGALFIFKFYRGYDIIKKKRDTAVVEEDTPETEIDLDKGILPNATVKITFAGLHGKISTKKKTSYPIWNESLTISELYPPLSERIKIDLLYQHKGHNKFEAVKKYISLHSLCSYKEPNAFLPSFGPTYLHFYKKCDMGEEYVGKLLMALETKVFADTQTKTRATFNDGVPPVFDSSLWDFENVFLFASIASVSVIDKRYVNTDISFELNWGRMRIIQNPDTNEPIVPHVVTPRYKPLTKTKEFWHLDFRDQIPCMHIINSYPNLMRRMFRANQIDRIAIKMGEKLKSMRVLFKSDAFISHSDLLEEKLLEYFDYVTSACNNFKDLQKVSDKKFETQLDQNKNKYILDEMNDMIKVCKTAYVARMKKKSFRVAEKLFLRIVKLMDDPQECWPNVYFWMKNGRHKTECLKFETRDLVYSFIPEEKGKYCGQLNNFYFMTKKASKSLSPVVCKIELYIWLGLEKHKHECFKQIPQGFKIPDSVTQANFAEIPKYLILNDFIMFNCRVHIYQGRFVLAFDYTGLSDFFVRIIIHDQSKQTMARSQTLNPIWDETLILRNITCYGTKQQIREAPPPIVLEVNDKDKWSMEYVGFCLITPTIKFKEEGYAKPKFPPKLQWHKVKVEEKEVGEVLAAVEFLEITGDETEDESYLSKEAHVAIPSEIRPVMINYKFEVFLWGVRHLKKLNHMPIRAPKIVIECSEYKIQSEVATITSLNFAKTLLVANMSLPVVTGYIPPIMIKLFECKSMGRCIYAGTHISFIQEFLYHPVTSAQYNKLMAMPKRTSLETLPSKTDSMIERELDELFKKRAKQKRRQHRMWKIRSFCSCSNFRGLCKMCFKGWWRGFKKTLRFICCLLLCCGCGRMFRKKKDKVKTDQDPAKFYRTKETVIDVETAEMLEKKDWWSKYFNSLGDPYANFDNGLDRNFKMKVYDNELEHQTQFNHFQDVFSTYDIFRGKTTGEVHEDEKAKIGAVKCKIRAYEWPENRDHSEFVTPMGRILENGYFQDVPSNNELRFLLRVYCVRGIKLRPTDASGTSDTYIVIRMSNQVIEDKKNYVPKNSNPFYGRCFELEGSFPRDNSITIGIYDWDKHSRTDLIGQTKIDIENRFYSRHHANCGLPIEYSLFGETPWRDIREPTEILASICEKCNIPPPIYRENKVFVADKAFVVPFDKEQEIEDDMIKREMMALYVLHRWNQIPIVGFHLVPEHVETRSLYHPNLPGIEQGKLQMWIDIFPRGDAPIPHQVNITTRAPVGYELRVIVWNTDNVVLNEDDFFGDRKSDIYVKGWMTSPNEAQETDVHYRSMSGEGNFNWRFVFTFDYLSAENMLVDRQKRGLFKIDGTERKLPCRLTLQVWDNDMFSKDDFLGSLTLYLNRMPRGAKFARQCTIKNFEQAPRINLFKLRRTRGWWPFQTKLQGNHMKNVLSGKLEAEFELLTSDQATIAPVGLGREPPQPLPPPKRPSTSFNWIFNPWKTFRFILWKNLKWKLLLCFVIVMGGLFLALFLYSMPGYSVKRLLGA